MESLLTRLLVLNIAIMITSLATANPTSHDCHRCGNVEIPYPFGTSPDCYLDPSFNISCNHTFSPPKPFIGRSNIEVLKISIPDGEIEIFGYVAKDCYPKIGLKNDPNSPFLRVSSFTVSHTKNKFIVIGCDTNSYIDGGVTKKNLTYRSSCGSFCSASRYVIDGPCSGSGCCKLDIPKGMKYMKYKVFSLNNHRKVLDFNPCGYAFVIQQNNFSFSSSYIANFPQDRVPLVLDWGIKKSNTKYSCKAHTKTNNIFSIDGSEYRCQCEKGYEGVQKNPYLGCRDIDECERKEHDCVDINHCKNTNGSFSCYCPKGHGDGKLNGIRCTTNPLSHLHIRIIVGIGVGFLVLLIGITWIYIVYKKWKFIQRKDRFFKNNGGFLLRQHLSQLQTDTVRIFTQEELEKATNKFDESAVVGKGGYGTVYKGVFDDGLVVAIKKSKLVDQSQTDQFINEVIVLSQINHRNVVKLIGCCLETEVPLLVYEFITNGTLFDHIHDKSKHPSLSWEARLKIASQTAGVLAYLHSSAHTPIIHRDIKPTNILLDHNYTAKVSDFGASKLVPLDKTQLSTMVQGTLGYLDPEYLMTSELTEKSDVYSFGIVLLELITGKTAMCFDGPEVERNLAMYALCAIKEDRVEEVVEDGMATEKNVKEIKEAAKLAKGCLKLKGEERPSMKEVAMELEGLRQMHIEHSWANNNLSKEEELLCLLHESSNSSSFVINCNMNDNMEYIIGAQILSPVPNGR